jgi:hypothetical protein
VVALALSVPRLGAAAPPIDPQQETAAAEQELASAEALSPGSERMSLARSAAQRFEVVARTTGAWQPAARASDAHLLAGNPPLASAWYWLATDAGDYSDAYVAWQERAVDAVFTSREAVMFRFSEPAKTLRVDGFTLPYDAIGRAVALDRGDHAVSAVAESGATYDGKVPIEAGGLGKTSVFPIAFGQRAASEGSPDGNPKYPRRPGEEGISALQIVTIVATTTLATGIAIGGGYLLLGGDNPRGIDTPQGAAIIATEVVLIGAGVTIAILSD